MIEEFNEIEEQDKVFKVDNDEKAQWCLDHIVEIDEENKRLNKIYEYKIENLKREMEELNKKCNSDKSYFEYQLREYIKSGIKTKKTKTQESYQLAGGKIVLTKPKLKLDYKKEDLLKYIKDSGDTEFIKVKEEVDWANFKKGLIIDDGKIINSITGELIEDKSLKIVESEEKFEIKF